MDSISDNPTDDLSSGIEMRLGAPDGGRGNGGVVLEEDSLLRIDNKDPEDGAASLDEFRAKAVYRNFCLMSVLFSAVPAAALACLSLATARLGETGAWQSGVLFLSYTLCAVTIAIHIVKQLGSKRALIVGMTLFCVYIGCFFFATLIPNAARSFALTGAAIGGIGAGILWTSQGTYFTEAAEEYASFSGMDLSESTSSLGGTFAFALLIEETTLDLLSTLLVREFKIHWAVVFSIYFLLAIVATGLMVFVKAYPRSKERTSGNKETASLGGYRTSTFYQATATLQLLVNDSKMKYMIGMNAAFGFAGAFLDSFVNGEVVPIALNDSKASLVGLLVAFHGGAAAIASLAFAQISRRIGKGPVLYLGAVCFAWVAAPFLIQPSLDNWTFEKLIGIYCLQGIGRATFEGTLKAVFADFFSYDKEVSMQQFLQVGPHAGNSYLRIISGCVCQHYSPKRLDRSNSIRSVCSVVLPTGQHILYGISRRELARCRHFGFLCCVCLGTGYCRVCSRFMSSSITRTAPPTSRSCKRPSWII